MGISSGWPFFIFPASSSSPFFLVWFAPLPWVLFALGGSHQATQNHETGMRVMNYFKARSNIFFLPRIAISPLIFILRTTSDESVVLSQQSISWLESISVETILVMILSLPYWDGWDEEGCHPLKMEHSDTNHCSAMTSDNFPIWLLRHFYSMTCEFGKCGFGELVGVAGCVNV